MVRSALDGWNVEELDFCSSKTSATWCARTFDLGEDLRLVLFSVTRRRQAAQVSTFLTQQTFASSRSEIWLRGGIYGAAARSAIEWFAPACESSSCPRNRRRDARVGRILDHPPVVSAPSLGNIA